MKIGILSDIHVDLAQPGPQSVSKGITTAIKKNDIDTMIIAGDVANDYQITLQTLRQIENASGVQCLFVPGNHDIWNENHPDKTAWEIYDQMLAHGPET